MHVWTVVAPALIGTVFSKEPCDSFVVGCRAVTGRIGDKLATAEIKTIFGEIAVPP